MKRILIFTVAILATASAFSQDVLSVSVTLRDSSVIKGTIAEATAFDGNTVFKDGVKIPASLMRKWTTEGTGVIQVVTLENGDTLHFTPSAKTLAIASVLGELSISITNICGITFAKGAAGCTDGLIYYCTFDSQASIEQPAVGPAGKFLSGRFVEGKVGNALAVPPFTCASQTPIPAGFFGPKGCIEFWGKINREIDGRKPYGGAGQPVFFDCQSPNDVWKLTVAWNPNNGVGGSGLCGSVQHYPAASDAHLGETFEKYLGNQCYEWHHYALVWNTTGIPSLGVQDGISVKVAVYLDGAPLATRTNVRNPIWGVSEFKTTPTMLGFPVPLWFEHFNTLPISIDEFKVWNYDKVLF